MKSKTLNVIALALLLGSSTYVMAEQTRPEPIAISNYTLSLKSVDSFNALMAEHIVFIRSKYCSTDYSLKEVKARINNDIMVKIAGSYLKYIPLRTYPIYMDLLRDSVDCDDNDEWVASLKTKMVNSHEFANAFDN